MYQTVESNRKDKNVVAIGEAIVDYLQIHDLEIRKIEISKTAFGGLNIFIDTIENKPRDISINFLV